MTTKTLGDIQMETLISVAQVLRLVQWASVSDLAGCTHASGSSVTGLAGRWLRNLNSSPRGLLFSSKVVCAHSHGIDKSPRETKASRSRRLWLMIVSATSATFYGSKPVTRPPQNQAVGKQNTLHERKSCVVQLLGINTEKGEELEPLFKSTTGNLRLCNEINNIPVLCSRIILPHLIDTLIFSCCPIDIRKPHNSTRKNKSQNKIS